MSNLDLGLDTDGQHYDVTVSQHPRVRVHQRVPISDPKTKLSDRTGEVSALRDDIVTAKSKCQAAAYMGGSGACCAPCARWSAFQLAHDRGPDVCPDVSTVTAVVCAIRRIQRQGRVQLVSLRGPMSAKKRRAVGAVTNRIQPVQCINFSPSKKYLANRLMPKFK